MKRSRIKQQKEQEEGSSAATVLRSIPRSSYPQDVPQSSSFVTTNCNDNTEAKNPHSDSLMSIPSDDFEKLSPHRYVFKLMSILCILGLQLWALGLQSGRFAKMEGAASGSIRVGKDRHSSGLPSSLHLNENDKNRSGSIAIAHLGNSIQYYNDCPRLLEHMMQQTYATVTQDSCLRGGANVTNLWEKGNGMRNKFTTPSSLQPDGSYDIGSPTVEALLSSSSWDYVVINDHTQAPVRATNKTESIQTFREKYIPLLQKHNPEATVILLMTAAYKSPAKNSSDLGGFDNFTQGLVAGYAEYATLFDRVQMAPLGLAYQYIKEHNNTAIVKWETLYAPDDFHPSPHGTYLEASLLYCTITGKVPPDYNVYWWSRARYMQPTSAHHPPMALPTREEADYLRTVATHICNVKEEPSGGLVSSSSFKI